MTSMASRDRPFTLADTKRNQIVQKKRFLRVHPVRCGELKGYVITGVSLNSRNNTTSRLQLWLYKRAVPHVDRGLDKSHCTNDRERTCNQQNLQGYTQRSKLPM